MRLNRLAAVLVAAAAFTAPAIAAPAAQAQGLPAPITPSDRMGSLLRQQGCKAHYLIAVPGGANTVEGVPSILPHGGQVFTTGLLVQAQTAGAIQPLWVSYNSAAFAQRPYHAASAEAYNATRKTVQKLANSCPQAAFSFTGYSLGADVTARLTRDIAYGSGPISPDRVNAVALIANPYQGHNGATLSPGTSPDSVGALGELEGGYGQVADRVLEICRADDIVCSMREEYRPLVAPALRTHLSAGRLPVKEFEPILRRLGADTLGIVSGMAAHGRYTTFGPQQAADWIVGHATGEAAAEAAEAAEAAIEAAKPAETPAATAQR